MFSGMAKFEAILFELIIILFPLGIWKLIEIIIWIVMHISIHYK